jgi:protein subunit release factor B
MPERKPVFSVRLEDCEVQTFRAGGPGGQNQNKRDTGVRILHHPSGARGESREHRSQHQNKRAAMIRLSETPQFRYWVKEQLRQGPTVEERVEAEMADEKIRTEVKQDGKWTEVDKDDLVG